MRIGIDGSCLANRRGFGRFTRELIRALANDRRGHDFVVFVDRPSLESVTVPPEFGTCVVEVREAPSKAASADGRRRFGDLFAMSSAVARAGLDLMYFPASYSFFPIWNVGRVVVTLHDTLALAYPELVFPTQAGRLAWKAKEHLAVAIADRIVTVSETSRRDLLTWFRLRPDRVVAITEGPDPTFGPRTATESAETLRRFQVDPGQRYLLYVGGLSPHKNILSLIQAFAQIPNENVSLVIVGDFGDVFHTNVQALKAAVDRFNLASRVVFTGFVSDHELAHLYSRAYALVQPSLMEGFGLPAIEAMACGCPLISSTAGSLPEVIGDAGLFFDPRDVDALVSQINYLLINPAEQFRLGNLARERAGLFTWEAAARGLMDCFEEVVRSKGRRRVIA